MRTVAITGASGYIGQRLIEHLEHKDWCSRILGSDIRDGSITSGKLTFLRKDIRDHSLIDVWRDQDVETLVHLAFIVNPMHDEKTMYDINVNGTLNVLRICKALQIGHIIVVSSGTAYGAWPDNPEPLKEDDPIRLYPPSFSYAHHKGLNEGHCADFMREHPGVIFNIVRPAVVYGPNVDNYISRFVGKLPVVPLIDGNDPNMQFVHEEDVAQLLTLLIEKKIPGSFNVASEGVIRFSEAGAMVGRKPATIPRWLMHALCWVLWRLHLIVETPPGIINYLAYPWVVDISKAKDLLGYTPRYTSQETARIMFKTHGYTLKE